MSNGAANSLTLVASESRGDYTSPTFRNDSYKGGDFFVDQTAQGSTTAFVQVKIQGLVPGTTSWYTLATISPATSAAWTKRVRVYPGASTGLNSTGLDPTVLNEFLPPTYRVTSTNVSTSAVTWSCGVNLFAY